MSRPTNTGIIEKEVTASSRSTIFDGAKADPFAERKATMLPARALAIDAEPIKDLFKLFVIDIVGGMEMLGFRNELERIVALQAITQQDILKRLEIVGIDK